MSRIYLKANLVSENDELCTKTYGIKTNNKIVYKENNITVTIIYFNNRIKMNRVCDEYKISLLFEKNKKTESEYFLSNIKKKLLLNTYTSNLDITDKYIKIDYKIEENNFSYYLEFGG